MRRSAEHAEIRPLKGDLDEGSDDSDERSESGWPEHVRVDGRSGARRHLLRAIAAAAVLGAVFAGSSFGSYLWARRKDPGVDLARDCPEFTTVRSPIQEDVSMTYYLRQFTDNIVDDTIYSRPGSPEVDAAWHDFDTNGRLSVVPYERGINNGFTDAHVRRAEKYGGGFVSTSGAWHNFHCLNVLRRALYFNFDYYKAQGVPLFQKNDRIVQLHVSHCIESMRQYLMCNIDTTIMPQVWYSNDGDPMPFTDYHVWHMCRGDYEEIRMWDIIHQDNETDFRTVDDYFEPPLPQYIRDVV